MNKIERVFVSLAILIAMTGCANVTKRPNSSGSTIIEKVEDSKIVVIYFTFPETDETDASAGASRVIDNNEIIGNTEYIANVIVKGTGADILRIQTVQDYPGSHDPLVDQAADEKEKQTRPELEDLGNLDQFDIIFIGYPNWWADMPMPLYTFLEEYDFSGKTIIPFSTHGGNGFSDTIEEIEKLQPNAVIIRDGITISRDDITDSTKDINSWIEELGLNK